MHILKSGIALLLLLSACETLPDSSAQPLLTVSAPAATSFSDPFSQSQPMAAAPQPSSRTPAEVAFMKAQLNALQPRSIAENREYCGYLGLTPSGDYAISPPTRGSGAGCRPDNPPASLRIIASYHTHAAYAPRYDSEAPSATDLEGDIAEGINGYVSTPGGRVWFVDGRGQQVVLLCGLGCVASDPRFRPDPQYPVRDVFSLAALQNRL